MDGLEIVASLYLVVQRRAGRPTGWVPWVALVVGTTASLAANVAVGGDDLIGKALAGWPAISMLAAVKLLFSMIDHTDVDQRTVVVDDQRPSADRPPVRWTVPGTVPDGRTSSGTVPSQRTDDGGASTLAAAHPPADSTQGQRTAHAPAATPVNLQAVVDLVSAARQARTELAKAGRSLSRDNLADRMRNDGYGLSNARAGMLVKILKSEATTDHTQPAIETMLTGTSDRCSYTKAPGLDQRPTVAGSRRPGAD